jgi:hypothetical protein
VNDIPPAKPDVDATAKKLNFFRRWGERSQWTFLMQALVAFIICGAENQIIDHDDLSPL